MNKKLFWPLKERIEMNKNKIELKLAGFLIKKNINIKTVKSVFNVFYSDEPSTELSFDVHFPTNFPSPLPCIFYFHGGALLSGDKSLYTCFLKKIAKNGFVIVNVNYPLMPNAEIENILSSCTRAIRYAISNHKKLSINTNQIIMGGDSAGAYLASFLTTQFQNGCLNTKPEINFIGTFLYYGMFDLTSFNAIKFPILSTMHSRYVKVFDNAEKQKCLNSKNNKKFCSCKNNFKKSDLFLYYKNYSVTTFITKNFPPTFIATGKIDKLHKQSQTLIKHLKKHKIPHTAIIFPTQRKDALHAFLNIEFLPSARFTFKELLKFLNNITK